MKTHQSIRDLITSNAALFSFLIFYTSTVVLGNVLYATPIGTWLVDASGTPRSILELPSNFTIGFWLLLLSPLLIVPALTFTVAPLIRKPLAQLFATGGQYSKIEFAALSIVVYGLVYFALYKSGAIDLFSTGITALDVISNRFVVLNELNFIDRVMILSLSMFLALYAVASFLLSRSTFWAVASAICVGLTACALILLNWKWPILLLNVGIVAAVLILTSPRRLVLKAFLGLASLVLVYLLVSAVVLRLAPQTTPSPAAQMENIQPLDLAPTPVDPVTTSPAEQAPATVEDLPAQPSTGPEVTPMEIATSVGNPALIDAIIATAERAPLLMGHAINRMASAFPYYYNIFTEQGPVCGTFATQYLPGPKPCHPSYLVYETAFPGDGYEGRGTSPAAPHITAYAFGGWFGAVFGLVGMGLVTAFFSAVPTKAGPMAATVTVLGVITGYHLSQVPGEEVAVYPTGVVWPLLLVCLHFIFAAIRAKSGRNHTPVDLR